VNQGEPLRVNGKGGNTNVPLGGTGEKKDHERNNNEVCEKKEKIPGGRKKMGAKRKAEKVKRKVGGGSRHKLHVRKSSLGTSKRQGERNFHTGTRGDLAQKKFFTGHRQTGLQTQTSLVTRIRQTPAIMEIARENKKSGGKRQFLKRL